MSWLDGVRHRLRALFRSSAHDAEIEEEMRFHLELDAVQQRDDLRAVRRFGNRTYYKEEVRQMTWLGSLDVLRQDLSYVWRTIVRSPALTITIVATFALGIGVNTAVFTVLDRLYLRTPGGVENPGTLRTYWIEHFNTTGGIAFTTRGMGYTMFETIADASGDRENLVLFTTDNSLRMGKSPRAPRIRGVYATANYFSVLGVRPAFGRFFTTDEDRLGSPEQVAVVSHRFWMTELGGDSAVLGGALDVNRHRYRIIGVAAPDFSGLELQPADVWMPFASMPPPSWAKDKWWEERNINGFKAVQRLTPSEDGQAIASRATQRIRALNRMTNPVRPDTQMNVYLGSIIEARGPAKAGQELVIATRLGGVAVIVLLIVCANVINLLLARAMRRRREIAVRLALGISRWRLVRLLTSETLVLAIIAGAAALLAAAWGGSLLRSLLLPEIEWADSIIDWRVIAFTAAVTLIAGLVAGVVPAVQSIRPDLTRALKSGGRHGDRHRSRLRSSLVVTQAALSVILLVGATLFVRSLQNVQSLDIGFDAGRLLFGTLAFPDGESPPLSAVGASMRDIAGRLESRPGVDAVARASLEPMRGFSFVTFYSGADSTGSFLHNLPTMKGVSPSFFRATGIRMLEGSGFSGDDADGAPAEVVVNEAMAKLLWPGRPALGQCMRFVSRDSSCYIVSGVVENARRDRVIEESPAPQYYLPLGNFPLSGWSGTVLIVRTGPSASTAAAAELRNSLRQAFPTAEPTVTPMTENLEPEYRPWRLGATLFTAFGVLALVVTLIGVFSTVSYDVSQRTHEFGVRVALGARVRNVLTQVVGEGTRTIAVGIVLGIALAIGAGRLIGSLLYGIEPHDPFVLAGVAMALLAVAIVATLVPAWRAARADPVIALRAD